MRAILGQLAGAWVAGSVLLGTVALILTDESGLLPVRPLDTLSVGALLGVSLLGAALFLVFFVLYWHTPGASWLHDGVRPAILWSVVVGGGGLAGWAFTAGVTFAAGFPHEVQLVLAYTAGGLPFALVAAMLQKPPLINAAALSITIAGLGIGYALAFDNDLRLTPLQYFGLLLRVLVGPTSDTAA